MDNVILYDMVDSIDLDSFSRQLEKLSQGASISLNFKELFTYIFQWQWKKAWELLKETIFHMVMDDFFFSKELLYSIIGIVIFSILFSRLSDIFQKYALGDYGFLVAYFLLFLLLFRHFKTICEIFENAILILSSFMKLLIPVYTLAITLTGNITTGTLFYEYFMVVVLILNYLCITFFVPLVQYYLLLELVSHLSQKANITNLCNTLYIVLSKGLVFLSFLFFGLHFLEMMISPAFDGANHEMVEKIVGVIPGAGSVVQTMTSGVLSSTIMIKNTLGVASILFLIVILLPPLLKLFAYLCIYTLIVIIMEPAADSRLLDCLIAVRKGSFLLSKALLIAMTLFVIILGTTSIVTNMMI